MDIYINTDNPSIFSDCMHRVYFNYSDNPEIILQNGDSFHIEHTYFGGETQDYVINILQTEHVIALQELDNLYNIGAVKCRGFFERLRWAWRILRSQ